jgi:uncharacterized protein YigE (DUF2233 family)
LNDHSAFTGAARRTRRPLLALAALHVRDVAGCRDALYLDGAISRLFEHRTGRDDPGGDMGAILGIVA